MELNLTNKCRACLGDSVDFYNINDEFDQSLTLLDICIDVDLQMNEDCELSPYLCKHCTSVIVDFYNLKVIYNDNRNQIHKLLSGFDCGKVVILQAQPTPHTDTLSGLEDCETNHLDESNQTDGNNEANINTQVEEDDNDNHNESDTIQVEVYSGSEEETAENEEKSQDTDPSVDDDDDDDKQEKITITYDNDNLEYYQRVNNNEMTKYILCPKCGDIFDDETEIEQHLMMKHEIFQEATDDDHLPTKNQTFQDDETDENHSITQNDVGDGVELQKKNICDVCGASFIKKSYLKDHKEIHDTERRYICNYCNKAFKRRTVLVKHKRIHTHPRQCICEVCGKAFNDKGTLKTHIMLLHVKLRNYDCMICGMKFPLKATLEKHIRRHQNKQREYFCTHCPLGYKDKSSLDRHIYIKHSGANTKVTCKECGKQYSTVSNLLKHKRICHQNNGQIIDDDDSNTGGEIDETSLL